MLQTVFKVQTEKDLVWNATHLKDFREILRYTAVYLSPFMLLCWFLFFFLFSYSPQRSAFRLVADFVNQFVPCHVFKSFPHSHKLFNKSSSQFFFYNILNFFFCKGLKSLNRNENCKEKKCQRKCIKCIVWVFFTIYSLFYFVVGYFWNITPGINEGILLRKTKAVCFWHTMHSNSRISTNAFLLLNWAVQVWWLTGSKHLHLLQHGLPCKPDYSSRLGGKGSIAHEDSDPGTEWREKKQISMLGWST